MFVEQLLYTSGLLFMGATEEQMAFLVGAHVSHVSYILLLFSIAFLMFLFVCMLLHLYSIYTWPVDKQAAPKMNGAARENGHVRPGASMGDAQRLRDAEEFELEGLMSEDDDTEGEATPKAKKPSLGLA